MDVELLGTGPERMPLLRNLFQFYCYDTSAHDGEDVAADGLFAMSDAYFGRYWAEAGWRADLIQVDGQIAGFLLIEKSDQPQLDLLEFADLFLMPKYRRRGIGRQLIWQEIVNGRQDWVVTVFNDDAVACAFWTSMFKEFGYGQPERLVDPHGRNVTVHLLKSRHSAMALA